MNHSEDFGRVTWAGTEMPCSWKTGQVSSRSYQSMTSLPQNSSNLENIVNLLFLCSSASSVWLTTNQRFYQAEPVIERARLTAK